MFTVALLIALLRSTLPLVCNLLRRLKVESHLASLLVAANEPPLPPLFSRYCSLTLTSQSQQPHGVLSLLPRFHGHNCGASFPHPKHLKLVNPLALETMGGNVGTVPGVPS